MNKVSQDALAALTRESEKRATAARREALDELRGLADLFAQLHAEAQGSDEWAGLAGDAVLEDAARRLGELRRAATRLDFARRSQEAHQQADEDGSELAATVASVGDAE